MKKLALLALAALLTACFSQKVLDAPIISMTLSDPPRGGKTVSNVTGKYCIGDPPSAKKGNEIGLVDEATLDAQKKHKVDYLTNAIFIKEGGMFQATCMTVTAKGLKGKGGGKKKKKKR